MTPVAAPPPVASAPVYRTPDQPTVYAALTQANVRVSTTFKGARIVLYGAVFNPDDNPADVVVVVRGPTQPVRLVRKVKVAGVWLNSRPVLFEGAPGYYMAASTRELGQIADFGTLRRLSIGVDHLKLEAPEEQQVVSRYGVPDVVVSRLAGDYLDWRNALIRLKQKAKLYDVDARGVSYVDRNHLFRAELLLPTDAPTGRYDVQVMLFKGGAKVSERDLTLRVKKVGFERSIYSFAHRSSWLYGLMSVAIAMLSGWVASRLFRRT
ncbi:MAG: TIGR02186 family protein [Proteobacteria bacterium]|nr:TIGR02186 family protein [Pseudomonadota bacterium]